MAGVNMRQIEVFLCAARHENLSRAAAELYVSQPALSKAIKSIEKDFGSPLFSRTNRGVKLTEEGRELYARLDFEYHHFRVSVEDIFRRMRLRPGALRIGCLNREVVFTVAREQVQAYALQHPEKAPVLERYDPASLRRKLLCEELDAVMTLDSELLPPEEFDTLYLCEYPLFFLVTRALGEAGLEALNGRPLFIESPVQRQRAEEICRSCGIQPSETRYAGSYFMLDTLIGREGGFAIDSKMVPYGTEGAEIVYLPVRRAFHDKVVLAWRREKHAPAVEDFAAFLQPGDGELSPES
jgi:DNA-binding transcriptional LysR family regulator